MDKKLKVSSNPHVRDGMSTRGIMLAVIIALMPATIFGVINFGYHALLVILVSIGFSVLSEFVMCKILKKPVSVGDCSAIVTGLLLALNLPSTFPLWMTAIGACFAIVVVKMLFGGLGQNFMNPALGARCFLVISFAKYMTNFTTDVYTGPTPLAIVKAGGEVNIFDMVIGRTAGTIGETSMIAIVLGACFLIALGIIDLKIPGSYIVSFVIFILLFSKRGFDLNYICAQLAGGGLMLGAFFMATDYVTRPITKKGQYLFGILLGILTGVFRIFGPGAEGVSFAIILGNLLVPLIEKITLPKAFGKGGENSL
ncbi:MAG: RnfABCDGE type electron transport complex subunit D [Lachnospiraceae bacterium]|nr:RnfABCDGE type electron transport complex subunit D [Lachnospiraceae bacterium]MBR4412402.1 RnfABCDGE type electron transport complex subunit D [Lachnospiraceae bacterium]MBR5066044.1 RnfABCDGE type electron transport complex subunit D [Lachnospiraceae bacterium]MBR5916619.1 RnfABCDGE type electron transport complex subunit D [Lachnospiraceae bacterium]